MVEPGLLAAFVVAAFIVLAVPGITVSAVASTALARGIGAGFLVEFGVQLGRLSMVLVVAFALEAVTGVVEAAFDVIKYAGAAYLVWLGVSYLRSRRGLDVSRPVAAVTPARLVGSGFLVLWSNPKALIFFGAFLPQFVSPAYPAWPQILVLGLIEMALGLVTDGMYVVLAGTARSKFADRHAAALNRIAGLVLIAGALWLAVAHRA